ncbi:L-threonine ammonia-lyase [Varanus komodoensis]|uniref:L-serine deaminase n=1 Tax=Varanus komodoensis TaxID=61221 RepID=A0A8D2JGQ4_VARKO|nr:L-threonine dehydratase catabolic TdcB-like isoform X2 [Varanus komodoensis]KAF7247539.1 L-threonine ammonia-lyase [Varanus komodoensis]
MDGPRFAPGAKPLAIISPGSLLPPYGAVIRVLLRFFVYFIAILYRAETKVRKLNDPSRCELQCCKDGPVRNGPTGQRTPSINPERLKDFGEEDYLNGGVKTWEMKIMSQNEELLRDPAVRPERLSLAACNRFIRFEDISAAAFKIQCGVQKTPCMYSRLSKQYGMDIYLKKEFLQYTGSVKERGVLYLLMSLKQDQQRKGVIVASDSSFSMAVAYHASEHQIPVFVIMSTGTSPAQVKMCRDYGAMVISYGSTVRDSQLHAKRLAQENGYLYLEEEDSAAYLSGLGTMGLEIYEQVPKLDAVIFPAGAHCGLLAGSAAALKHLNPHISVIGVESETFPVLQQSFKTGHASEDQTQGSHQFYREVSGPCFGTNSLQLTGKFVDKVVTVREADILLSMLRLLEYERATVDAEGAIGLAALVAGKLPELKGKRVAVAVCSGNLELPLMRQCMDRALTLDNRVCKFSILISDCPGDLSKLLEILAREEARVLDISREHLYKTSDLFTSEITCIAETRDKIHTAQLKNTLIDRYPMMTWMER